jgi:hypothetical protein
LPSWGSYRAGVASVSYPVLRVDPVQEWFTIGKSAVRGFYQIKGREIR